MRISDLETKYICESPSMVSSTDFNLIDDDYNRNLTKSLLPKVKEKIKDYPDFTLVRTGDDYNGNIALIDKTSEPRIHYFVKYKAMKLSPVGLSVTQVNLWKRNGVGVRNITTDVFENYLMTKYDAIASDTHQTNDGQRFWMDRMAIMSKDGFKVGLIEMNDKSVEWYDPKAEPDITRWYDTVQGWGNGRNFITKRYIISK